MTTASEVVVHLFDDAVSRRGHVACRCRPEPGMTVGEVVRLAAAVRGKDEAAWQAPVCVIEGVVVDASAVLPENVGEVHAAPGSPGDPGTIILAVIAIATTVASVALAPRLRGPASQPTDGDRRSGFVRYSRAAARGEPVPVVFGEIARYGPVKVAAVPVGSETGDTTLRLLYVIGEGPVAQIGTRTTDGDGLPVVGAGAVGDIWLNDQPIASVPGAKVSVRMGTAGGGGQESIPGFADTETPRPVAAGAGGQVLRNTSGADRAGGDWAQAFTYTSVAPVDHLVLRVGFPRGLATVSSAGQVTPRRVRLRYRTRPWTVGGTGTWSAPVVKTIERASQADLGVSIRLDRLPGTGAGVAARFEVQVQRVTAEPATVDVVDEMRLVEVIEARKDNNTYAGLALLALEIPVTDQFASEPRVSVRVKGYAGLRVWDGVSPIDDPTFTVGWSRHPVDIALALLTDAKIGLGGQIDEGLQIDVAGLLECRGYACAYLDAAGVRREKPFACDLAIIEDRPILDVLREVLACCRVTPVFGDVVRFVQDKPRGSAVDSFTDGSIVRRADGRLAFTASYQVTRGGISDAPNQIRAQFEAADVNDQTSDVVTFPAVNELWLGSGWPGGAEVVNARTERLVGITDRDLAVAEAVYRLKSARARDVVYTFDVVGPWLVCGPMDLIDVSCSAMGWGLYSGRVLAGSTTASIRLDREIVVPAGAGPLVIRVLHLDGTAEVATMAVGPGVYPPAFDVPVTLTQAPGEGAQYAVAGEGGVEAVAQRLQVLGVSMAESSETGGRLVWTVVAAPYVADVHAPERADAVARSVTRIGGERSAPGPVTSLAVIESGGAGGGGSVALRLVYTQTDVDRFNTATYRVFRRQVGASVWQLAPGLSAGQEAADAGVVDPAVAWEFRVVAVSALGAALSPDDARHPTAVYARGVAAAAPATPTSLNHVVALGNRVAVAWDPMPGAREYQVLAAGVPTANPNGGAENALVERRTGTNGIANMILAPGREARLWVRSVNAAGRLSPAAAALTIAGSALTAPPGKAVKGSAWVADLTSGGGGTFVNAAWSGTRSRLEIADAAANGGAGTWTGPSVDTGSNTLGEIALDPRCANDCDVGAVNSGLFDAIAVPSLEAEAFGTLSGAGASVVSGMIMPPWPDDRHAWTFEVDTSVDGSIWAGWAEVKYGAVLVRTFRYYRVRVTLRRTVPGTPYRPALASLAAVVVH